MAVNRYQPHLLVLSEDDATRSIAVGFSDRATGPIQVLPSVRGWLHVLERFLEEHVGYLTDYPQAHIVLLIDFDNDFPSRLKHFQERIRATLTNHQNLRADIPDRVYVLGALDEAETLMKAAGKKAGRLGEALAQECENGGSTLWSSAQLQHNQQELERLISAVKPFLF